MYYNFNLFAELNNLEQTLKTFRDNYFCTLPSFNDWSKNWPKTQTLLSLKTNPSNRAIYNYYVSSKRIHFSKYAKAHNVMLTKLSL